MSHVFISYARKDGRAHADRLDAALRESGYRTWLDRRDISADRDFTAEIEQGIEAAAALVLCLTPDAKQHDSFVRREVHYADMAQKPIYVARLDANTLPFVNVVTHTFIDFYKDWDASVRQLCAQLAKPTPAPASVTPAHPLRPYVQRLYESAKTHLDTAIIKLIDLEISETPDAVPTQPLDMIEMLFGDARGEREFHSFAEAFAHFNGRALLLGEPGAGKTVTLMSTARQAAADWLSDPAAHPLPVLGIIATWDSAKQPPLAEWLGAQKGLTPDALRGTMNAGNALLLLDGLDELGGERTEKRPNGTEERYDPRQRFITALNEQLGTNRALVTCRIADYEAVGQQVTLGGAVTLQRLTDAQMRVYLADLPDLQKAIDDDEGLREMARTPLLLSYLAFGFRDRPDAVKELHDLHEGALRDAIFDAYMEKRYDREAARLKKQGKTPPFTLEYIREVLGRLAMENVGGIRRRSRGEYPWHRDNVIEYSDFALVLPEDLIDAFITFCRDLHYLQQRSEGLGFIHLRLRDMLVYSYSLPRLRQHDLYTYTFEPNPASALGAIRDSRAFEPILSLFEDNAADSLLRECAAKTLGKIKNTRAAEALIRALADENTDVRSSAADALVNIGTPAVEPLIAVLVDTNAFVRRSAADALGQIGNPRAVAPLISALADASAFVRRSATYALGRIGDTRAVEPLISALADANEYVRGSTAYALVKLGEPAVEPLIAALHDANVNVRSSAAETLGRLGDARAVEPLIAALHDANAFVHRKAAYALSDIGEPSVEPLIRALANADDHVRSAAAYALEKIGNARAVEPLILALADENANVRHRAAEALGEFGDARAVEPLIRALGDSEHWVRNIIADALERIGTPEALAAVRAWRAKQQGG